MKSLIRWRTQKLEAGKAKYNDDKGQSGDAKAKSDGEKRYD